MSVQHAVMMVSQLKFYLRGGKKVMIACSDHGKKLDLLRVHFPHALFEIVKDGIIVWERNLATERQANSVRSMTVSRG